MSRVHVCLIAILSLCCSAHAQTGVCCFGAECISNISAFDCFFGGGTYYGGITCAEAPCVAIGACCFGSGGCTNNTTQTSCEAMNGLFLGDLSECGFVGINCPDRGSCCVNGQCSITFQSQCAGFWTEGQSCDPDPCQQPGACCYGVCCQNNITPANCGGVWLGPGTDCNSSSCYCTALEIWLTFGIGGNQCGTQSQPISALATAVSAVSAGGTLKITTGSSGVTSITITKPMTIQAVNGPVTLGN